MPLIDPKNPKLLRFTKKEQEKFGRDFARHGVDLRKPQLGATVKQAMQSLEQERFAKMAALKDPVLDKIMMDIPAYRDARTNRR